MLDQMNSITDFEFSDEDYELVSELERNIPEEIRKRRLHFRYTIKVPVTLQSGNASQLLNSKVQGITRDISSGGLGAIFPVPVNVGDIYRLEFDPSDIDLPLSFARCVSCALVREGAFSSGFKFLQNIVLPKDLEKRLEE
jgi:hypothetical protein